jgi:hypothetical protein
MRTRSRVRLRYCTRLGVLRSLDKLRAINDMRIICAALAVQPKTASTLREPTMPTLANSIR